MLKILITNDDGLSQGVKVLAKALSKYGLIYVSIPFKQMSAKSHSISIGSKINIRKPDETIPYTEDCILVEGTPADSSKMGLTYYHGKFDLVFSGVNLGLNIAKDVIYSGTVAAAREATVLGVPSVAISIERFNTENFEKNLEDFLKYLFDNQIYQKASLINVNLPSEESKGFKFTSCGKRLQFNQFSPLTEHSYRIDRSFMCYNEDEETDIVFLAKGYTTITPLSLDQTDYTILKGLRKIND